MKQSYQTQNFRQESRQMIEQANEIMDEYIAQGLKVTLRQLYYQFVSRDLLANNQKNYKRLGEIVSSGRLAGLIDWDAIEDRGRVPSTPAEWERVKALDTVFPAGQAFPTPRRLYSPDGEPEKIIEEKSWSKGMKLVVAYCQVMARELQVTHSLDVRFVTEATKPFSACWGHGGYLTFNVGRLGRAWFDRVPGAKAMPDYVVELLLHEFAHEKCSDHLDAAYHEELCRLGSAMRRLGHVEREILAGHAETEDTRG